MLAGIRGSAMGVQVDTSSYSVDCTVTWQIEVEITCDSHCLVVVELQLQQPVA